jgi:hypothetical protein
MENGQYFIHPGRSKTVELVSLESTVDELLALDIARHVRKLKFSPAYFVDGKLGLRIFYAWPGGH